MQALILAVHLPQSTDIVLQLNIQLCVKKEPVELSGLAPLSLLAEFLAHEEELLARMSCHVGVCST